MIAFCFHRRFVDLCGRALTINEQLINSNQQPYHENLQQCYISMAEELSQILHEPVSLHPSTMVLFRDVHYSSNPQA